MYRRRRWWRSRATAGHPLGPVPVEHVGAPVTVRLRRPSPHLARYRVRGRPPTMPRRRPKQVVKARTLSPCWGASRVLGRCCTGRCSWVWVAGPRRTSRSCRASGATGWARRCSVSGLSTSGTVPPTCSPRWRSDDAGSYGADALATTGLIARRPAPASTLVVPGIPRSGRGRPAARRIRGMGPRRRGARGGEMSSGLDTMLAQRTSIRQQRCCRSGSIVPPPMSLATPTSCSCWKKSWRHGLRQQLPAGSGMRPSRSPRPSSSSTSVQARPQAPGGAALPRPRASSSRRGAHAHRPPGLGKTMLAVCVATKQVQLGYTARFVTAQALAASSGGSTRQGGGRGRSHLCSCDAGARRARVSADGRLVRPGALRGDRGTLRAAADDHHEQQEPDRLGRVVQDVSLAAALVDRLMHHGEVFYLKGPSWRTRGRQLSHDDTGGIGLAVSVLSRHPVPLAFRRLHSGVETGQRRHYPKQPIRRWRLIYPTITVASPSEPPKQEDAHRLLPAQIKPEQVFCFKYERTVGVDNTVRGREGRHRIQVLPGPRRGRSYARARVEIHERLDGSLAVYHQGGR